jgi:hypothetical protein
MLQFETVLPNLGNVSADLGFIAELTQLPLSMGRKGQVLRVPGKICAVRFEVRQRRHSAG